MDTSKIRVTLSNDTPVTLACRNMVSRSTATWPTAVMASCLDHRNVV